MCSSDPTGAGTGEQTVGESKQAAFVSGFSGSKYRDRAGREGKRTAGSLLGCRVVYGALLLHRPHLPLPSPVAFCPPRRLTPFAILNLPFPLSCPPGVAFANSPRPAFPPHPSIDLPTIQDQHCCWPCPTLFTSATHPPHTATNVALQAVGLPVELSCLQRLRELRVEYAQLDVVPAGVQALTHLTRLSLEGNHLSSLPEGRYLTRLHRLSLANNRVGELPDGLAACSSLQDLSLAQNALSVSATSAEHLARALPHLRCLRVSLESTGGLGVPAQAAPAAAAGAAAAGEGNGGEGEVGPAPPPAAGPTGAPALAGAAHMDPHLQSLRYLARALGDRLVWEQ